MKTLNGYGWNFDMDAAKAETSFKEGSAAPKAAAAAPKKAKKAAK